MDMPSGIPTVVGIIVWAGAGAIFLYRMLLKDRRDSRRRESESHTRLEDTGTIKEVEIDIDTIVTRVEIQVRDALTEHSLQQDIKLLEFRSAVKEDLDKFFSRYFKSVRRN